MTTAGNKNSGLTKVLFEIYNQLKVHPFVYGAMPVNPKVIKLTRNYRIYETSVNIGVANNCFRRSIYGERKCQT